jgi:hypothetical protein
LSAECSTTVLLVSYAQTRCVLVWQKAIVSVFTYHLEVVHHVIERVILPPMSSDNQPSSTGMNNGITQRSELTEQRRKEIAESTKKE